MNPPNLSQFRQFHRSTAFRLALLYSTLSVIIIALLLGFLYWATAGYMQREMNATIGEEIIGLSEQYQDHDLARLTQSIHERISLNQNHEALYLLVDAAFQPIVGNLNTWPEITLDTDGWADFRFPQSVQDAFSDHTARARVFTLKYNLHLLVGRSTQQLDATRKLIFEAITWGSVFALVLSLGIGIIVSARFMRRFESINRTSYEIMQGDLSRRIPLLGKDDDFDHLAINLNGMLERIEQLMQSVHQVSDNIAHDLRTPLTRLHTRLEQLLNDRELSHRNDIEQALSDTQSLLNTFNALLRIARIESKRAQHNEMDRVDLRKLARDVVDLYEPVAADKNQTITLEAPQPALISGDKDLLFQVLVNLVDNAIKHTPENSQILIQMKSAEQECELILADSGPGIPDDQREKVFQRFYRTDTSRSTPGSGLGLSLVRAVIDLHSASIELADNAPGLIVRINFQAISGAEEVAETL